LNQERNRCRIDKKHPIPDQADTQKVPGRMKYFSLIASSNGKKIVNA
jgi:hypothetical protein